MTVLSNLKELWKTHRIITVVFIYNLSYYLYSTGFANLITQKICFPEGPPGSNVVCKDTEAFKKYNSMNTFRCSLHEVLSGLMVLLAGSWRDQTGLSRPLVLIAILGEMVGSVMSLVSSLSWEFSCWATVIVDSLTGILGSRVLVTVACATYAVDRATEHQRSTRISILMGSSLLGSGVANAIGGYVLNALTYSWFFVLVLVIYLCCIGMCFLALQGEKRRNEGVKVSVTSMFKGIKLVFKPRKNFMVSWLVIFANLAIYCAANGEGVAMHSFFQKVLVLNPEKAGLLSSFKLFSSCIMSYLTAPILHDVLNLSEFTISIICTIPSAISYICMAFAKTLLEAYISFGLDMMRIALMSLMWTVLIKCIKRQEIGVIGSFLAFGEAIAPLLVNYVYLYIVNQTIDYFPGAFYLLSASLTILTTCLLAISYYFYEEPEMEDMCVS